MNLDKELMMLGLLQIAIRAKMDELRSNVDKIYVEESDYAEGLMHGYTVAVEGISAWLEQTEPGDIIREHFSKKYSAKVYNNKVKDTDNED